MKRFPLQATSITDCTDVVPMHLAGSESSGRMRREQCRNEETAVPRREASPRHDRNSPRRLRAPVLVRILAGARGHAAPAPFYSLLRARGLRRGAAPSAGGSDGAASSAAAGGVAGGGVGGAGGSGGWTGAADVWGSKTS